MAMWSRTGTPGWVCGWQRVVGRDANGIKQNQERWGRGLCSGMPVGGEVVMDCLFSLRDKWE